MTRPVSGWAFVVGLMLGSIGLGACAQTHPPITDEPKADGKPYLVTFNGVPGSFVLTIPPGTVLTPTSDLRPFLTAVPPNTMPPDTVAAKRPNGTQPPPHADDHAGQLLADAADTRKARADKKNVTKTESCESQRGAF